MLNPGSQFPSDQKLKINRNESILNTISEVLENQVMLTSVLGQAVLKQLEAEKNISLQLTMKTSQFTWCLLEFEEAPVDDLKKLFVQVSCQFSKQKQARKTTHVEKNVMTNVTFCVKGRIITCIILIHQTCFAEKQYERLLHSLFGTKSIISTNFVF